MSKGKMGCIPKLILYGGAAIAVVAGASYALDWISPGTGTLLWKGLGQLLLDLIQMIKEAMS